MSAKEAQPSGASCFTLPLDSSRWLPGVDMKDKSREEKGEREEMDGAMKWQPKSLATTTPITGSTDVSEESEPESPPPIVRRKVSFADAFGLDLVSIKEFSSKDNEGKVEDYLCGLDSDEYYLSCLFTLPSPEVLLEKLEERKVALEAISLLPGTTSLRGTVRVANLCFQKNVYVRTTFDCWESHFDLLAEYIPGSSDRDTDGFSFRVTMVPPFKPEGVRVEFCLRYETPDGVFWENNDDMNYVLYCRKREHRDMEEKEKRKVKKDKDTKAKSKRSCLKAASKKIKPEAYTTEAMEEIPDSVSHKAEQRATRKAVDNTDRYASEECLQKTLVDSRRSRRRARMANVKDYFSKRETEAQLGQYSSDDKNRHSSLNPDNKVGTWSSATPTAELWRKDYADTEVGKGQVLTYHEIPLQSLSWDRNSRQEDLTNTPSHPTLCNGPFLEHLTEPTQKELDVSTQERHPTSVSKNIIINAVEEHKSPPLIPSHSQTSPNQSDSTVQTAGFSELVQMARTETDRHDSQDILWPQASPHVTAASNSSGLDKTQECVRHVIGDQEHSELEGNPAPDRAGKRSELDFVTRDASHSDSVLEGVEPDGHQVLGFSSSTDQMPQSRGIHGLKQVTNPSMRLDEAKTASMASEGVTAWEKLAPAAQSATQIATEGTPLKSRQAESQASENLLPQDSAQSSAEIITEAMLSTEAIESTGKIPSESTIMTLEQTEEETIAPEVTEASEPCAVEPARTQVSSPHPWVGEGSGGSELSVNTIAKVGGGESQDHVSPATGDDTVTFTNAEGATVRERAHPVGQKEGEEEEVEEDEEEMTAERREGEGEHPFKILNEREYKESGEAKTDTIVEKEGDLSQEMSHFKAAGSDVSVVFETDRLKCKMSEEKREDQGVVDWKEEMEKCLGLGREQRYVNEPALYEQFTKAAKGLERERQRTSDAEMVSDVLEGCREERCLTGDDSTTPAYSAQSEEKQERVILAQSGEELEDVSPNACVEGGTNEGIPVPSISALVDQHLAQDQHSPIPTPNLCSIQTTLGGRDPFLFHADEISPVLQVGAATWSTCAISAPLGDGHEIGVVLRHRRSPQPAEHLQTPIEEAEIHGQFPGIGAPGRGPEVVSPAPLSMWLSELCSFLSPVSRPALYAVLFAMFFLTAFVCDLPVCLAIYLFSVCWWCCHGEKQPLPGSKGVD